MATTAIQQPTAAERKARRATAAGHHSSALSARKTLITPAAAKAMASRAQASQCAQSPETASRGSNLAIGPATLLRLRGIAGSTSRVTASGRSTPAAVRRMRPGRRRPARETPRRPVVTDPDGSGASGLADVRGDGGGAAVGVEDHVVIGVRHHDRAHPLRIQLGLLEPGLVVHALRL